MALNYIWIGFFLIAFVFGIISLLMGDTTIFQKMVDSTFDSSKTAFETSLGLTGVLALWLGIMKIGERAGVVNVLARMLSPFFSKLFPDIPKNHPVMGSIFMNIASNMLGLDNAATPTGLKAMANARVKYKEGHGNKPDDNVLGAEYFWLDYHSYDDSCFPKLIRSGTAYGRIYPNFARNHCCNACWYYHYCRLAAYQYLSTDITCRSRGTNGFCRIGYLGFWTNG